MEEKNEDVYLAALAGLLHDIGKFAQRAGERGSLDPQTARQEHGYYHALLTADAIEALVPATWRKEVKLAAGNHHRPRGRLNALVQLADHLSAGEREADEDNRIPYLRSPFSSLRGHDARRYLPLEPLDPTSQFIYPYARNETWAEAEHTAEYRRLWDTFVAQARDLPTTALPTYVEALQEVLQQTTWSIPSAYYHSVPDVSLYDHSRMTGALAACMAADGRDGPWAREVAQSLGTDGEAADREVALLVGGDVSGIQSYLYAIASEGAAKSLRGRSFYLQLLTEAVTLAFLEALDLPATNLIYVGGGHFYLLAPTNPAARAALEETQTRLAGVLLAAHEGRLYLAVGSVPVTARRFMSGQFSAVWTEIHRALDTDKHRRFAALGTERMAEEIGAPLGEGGDPLHYCLVCGKEGSWQSDSDDVRKCTFCESLETLGNDLRDTTALILSTIAPPDVPIATWRDGLRALGLDVQVMREAGPAPGVPATARRARLWRLRETAPETVESHAPLVVQRHFLALVAPRIRDANDHHERVALFEELARASETSIKQWGVLRMDVDDLGKLFQEGLGQQATLSRVAGLSFQLRLFFEGHLPALAAHHNTFDPRTGQGKDTVYVMYAGGDDLFIVGTWEVLPHLALGIREAFREFVAENPHITLSAGITLHPEKYPLYLAAGEAGHALDGGAKQHTRAGGRGKDALTFLGTTIGWEEYPDLARQVVDWQKRIGARVATKGDVQLLRRAADLYREEQNRAVREGRAREGQRYVGRWAWQMVYALSRRRERARRHVRDNPAYAEYIQALDALEEALISKGAIRTVGLMARWAELLTRGSQDRY